MAEVHQLRPLPRKRIRQKRKRPGDPKYYSRIGRMGHWQPGKRGRDLGFGNVACGPDGPEAIAIAENMNRRLRARARLQAALQTRKFELQTALQTGEFELQTPSKRESVSWLRRINWSRLADEIMAWLFVAAFFGGFTYLCYRSATLPRITTVAPSYGSITTPTQ
jgi:hypothetical protein